MMTDTPYLDVFDEDARLILEPAPNGGWIVKAASKDFGRESALLGAFGNAKDMLAALARSLT